MCPSSVTWLPEGGFSSSQEGLSTGLLTTGLPPEWVIRERVTKIGAAVFYKLIPGVTHFCHILSTTQTEPGTTLGVRGQDKCVHARRQGSMGAWFGGWPPRFLPVFFNGSSTAICNSSWLGGTVPGMAGPLTSLTFTQ